MSESEYYNDLQLAAKYGKLLLEKNKELELALNKQQDLIEEKNAEIEYLNAQKYDLRKNNESTWKLCEKLECNIQKLEREKQRLRNENKNEKQIIRKLTACLENFEKKCFDLQKNIDKCQFNLEINDKTIQELISKLKELQIENSQILARNVLLQKEKSRLESIKDSNNYYNSKISKNQNVKDEQKNDKLKEQITIELEKQINDLKVQQSHDSRKLEELEEQISNLMWENLMHDNRLNDNKVKNLSDELLSIETVQKGYVCSQCLKSNNSHNKNYNHQLDSYNYNYLQSFKKSNDKENSYKDFVNKYETTLKSRNKLLKNNSEHKQMGTATEKLFDLERLFWSIYFGDCPHTKYWSNFAFPFFVIIIFLSKLPLSDILKK